MTGQSNNLITNYINPEWISFLSLREIIDRKEGDEQRQM